MLHGKDWGRSDGSAGSYIWSGKETQKVTMIMIQRRTKTNKIVKMGKRTKKRKKYFETSNKKILKKLDLNISRRMSLILAFSSISLLEDYLFRWASRAQDRFHKFNPFWQLQRWHSETNTGCQQSLNHNNTILLS